MKVNVDWKKTTKATEKRFPSTKKHIIICCVIGIILVMLMIVAFNLLSGQQFKADNVGRQVRIGWEEVNLREGPSTSKKVITILSRGSSVTLTGNSYSVLMGIGSPADSWTEVELSNGTTGWVVTTSIKSI